MRIKCYCGLYVSEALEKKKNQVLQNLMEGKLSRPVYILTLAGGQQNQLEFFSSLQLLQPYYEEKEVFVVGLAGDYGSAADLTGEIVQEVFERTGGTDVRSYILEKQTAFEER